MVKYAPHMCMYEYVFSKLFDLKCEWKTKTIKNTFVCN